MLIVTVFYDIKNLKCVFFEIRKASSGVRLCPASLFVDKRTTREQSTNQI